MYPFKNALNSRIYIISKKVMIEKTRSCAKLSYESNMFNLKKILFKIQKAIHTSSILLSDYYSQLGVERSASQKDIKSAYFKKVKQFHPDVNKSPDATEKFREIQEAYECLSDSKRRNEYDMTGSTSSYRNYANNTTSGSTRSANYGSRATTSQSSRRSTVYNETPFFDDDFFSSFFSNHMREQKFQIQIPVTLSFKEAVLGCEKRINVKMLKNCVKCDGKGVQPGFEKQTCNSCKGAGFISHKYNGIITSVQCNSCYGVGRINKTPCHTCSGSGKSHDTTAIDIKIIPGTENGSTLHLSDANNDIFIVIKVENKLEFQKEGYNIISDLKIDYIKAILGGIVEGETVHGKSQIKIPAGTSSHQKIVVPGKGVNVRGYKGDHIFNVQIVIPKKMSEEETKLVKELYALMLKNGGEKNTTSKVYSEKESG